MRQPNSASSPSRKGQEGFADLLLCVWPIWCDATSDADAEARSQSQSQSQANAVEKGSQSVPSFSQSVSQRIINADAV